MKTNVKKDTFLRKRVSRVKKRRIRYPFIANIFKRPISRVKTVSLSSSLAFITILAFLVNSPVVQFHPNELKDFSLSSDATVFRTGKPISFKWALIGAPQKLIIVFGDGSFQELSSECFDDNGMIYGSVDHLYGFQGKYTPILKAYYLGKTYKKILDVFIRNDAPLFSFGFNGKLHSTEGGLHTSASSFQTFEDEKVEITANVTNNLTNDTLTYQFNFGDSQVVTENNYITHAWENKGSYPVTITVVGAQGELSKQTQYVEVLNRLPNALIRIVNKQELAVGKEIEFTAEDSYDTLSDINNLRYLWNYGDGFMDYGKIVSHTYYESGSYNLTLIVKDDDSAVDQTSRTIIFGNVNPDITIVNDFQNSTLIVNEGEDILFSTSSQDDDKDIFNLLYYWNFDSVKFDPLRLEDFRLGGWKNKHVFEDDFEGNITVGVIDSSNEFDSDSINVQVLNVAPQIGVVSTNIISNISFQVYRRDIKKEGNFAFTLFKDNETIGTKLLTFANSTETYVSTNAVSTSFSLTNQWKIAVNSSKILPPDSKFQASVKLTFIDGKELILNSDQMMGESYGQWEVDLSREFYDDQNFSYKYPITLTTQVMDPSKDEVKYSVSYQENKLLEIDCSKFKPISNSFTVRGAEFSVEVYEQNSVQYANITAQKLLYSEVFDNHIFPLQKYVQIDISPLINIDDILQRRLELANFTVERCIIADNKIAIKAVDDDLGEDTLTFGFESLDGIKLTHDFVPVTYSITSNANPVPFGKIGGFSNIAYEGESVKFTSKTNDQDVPGMLFMWDFGDGTATYSEHAKHAWVNAGEYNITLTIADPYGNIHRDQKNITILLKAPEIVGPFAFQGSEGSSIVLDVEIYDSSKDEPNLEYFWYDDKGILVSQEQKPVFTLDDGTYVYTLKVVDPSGMSSSEEIVVTMHSLSPEIYMSNYMYHGVVGDYWFDNDGKLELTAYGADTLLDSEKLYFYWTIRNGKKIFRVEDGRYQHYSTITFTCKETTTYQGEVRVVDPEGNEKVVAFQIVSTIDSTLDGVDDEIEEMLKLSDEPTDTDGDGLTDTYELTVSNTSYLDPDTDGDLLWDGQTVNGNIGEQAISTDPLDWDSDDDFLSDGTEYFGWNITVVYFENSTTFHVTSESLDNDTDNDGLTDYAEYYAGSNPRQADTDNDDLTDDIDPFPTKWDGDGDMLSDFEEIARGTDYNNTDSDQDGLKDGEEVYGWGIGFFTNPLDADSDHDHVSDSAEIKNYLVKLQDEGFDDLDKKVNLTAPISLHFPHHFEQAVAAQISFGISFGEYGQNATDSYGIADIDVQDLYVIITKKENGVLLANFSTNNTRYFSQVVDVTSIMNNLSLGYDYYGDYEIGIGIPGGYSVQEGCYPGTYSFENDTVGGLPAGWVSHEGFLCDVEVLSSLDGHEKVVELFDTNQGTSHSASIYNEFTPIDNGTIEVWLRYDGYGENRYMQIFEDISWAVGIVALKSSGGNFYDANDNLLQACNNDQWYHVKLEFDCSADTFSVWIDGVLRTDAGEMPANFDNDVGVLKFATRGWGTSSDYWMYIDAVGFSWDSSYNIGNNEEELYYDYQFLTEKDNYRGTYSFEDDTVGGLPAGWTSYEGSQCDVEVLASLDGHEMIVELFDTYGGSGACASIKDEFSSAQASGTVEYWFRRDGYAENIYMRIWDGGASIPLYVSTSQGNWLATDGVENEVLQSYNNDQWYHVRVDFECGSGEYMGLEADTFYAYIDGVKYGAFDLYSDVDTVSDIEFLTRSWASSSDYWGYVDAVGYSWDPDYEIGDNLKNPLEAGCYLDYFELEFCRYLDPNDPDSDDDGILDGVEMGALVEGTDLIDFEDYYLYNNLTQNAIGNFSATYSFEDEADETTNTDIEFIDSVIVDSSCVAKITSEYEYHNKVLELSDDNNAGKIYAYNTAFDRQNGTIELWWAQTANNKDSIIYLYDDGTGTAITLYMRSTGQFSWYDGSYHDVLPYSATTWYHHKIVFNCSEGTNGQFSWYIDGILEAGDIEFQDDCDSLDKILLGTGTGSSGFDTFFDAIGFTWNWTYWEGENYEHQLPSDTVIGNYPGTYSFKDDADGGNPADWSIYEGSMCTVNIVGEVDGHKKVVQLHDGRAGTVYNAGMWNEFTPVDDGIIEMWLRVDNSIENRYIQLFDATMTVGVTALNFQDTGNLVDMNSNILLAYSNDVWYHVKIQFDCSGDTYSIWVDGDLKTDAETIPVDFTSDIGVLRYYTRGWGLTNYDLYVDAVGYSWDPNYEISDNNNSKGLELTAPDEFYLEIPYVGKVTDGQLDLEIQSSSTTEGSGKVFVTLVKEELNLTKSDIYLIDYCEEFDSSQQFSYQNSIDLSPYVTSGQVYGTYHLKVQAFSTDSSDVFNLTKFEIETDTYVVAEFGDYAAYSTDPGSNDTDGDGLTDYNEIFVKGTNPVNPDTDGDDCWDIFDRDPLRDVMIEIQPLYGEYRISQWPYQLTYNPILQIVINCSFVSEDYAIITPCEITTDETSPYDSYYHRAYFTDFQYYINIDDDEEYYDDEVMIPLQLWEVKRHLGQNDVLLAGEEVGGIWYNITNSSTQTLFTVCNSHWVKVNFTLVGIEKANTFALYGVNSTFTGRYHDREQGYSVIQLQIPDDGHYLGTESFLEEQIGANSTSIAFVDVDDSDKPSLASIIDEVDGHTNVLCLQEGVDDHADITHDFDSQTYGTIEWWWRTSDINGGRLYFYVRDNGDDAIRLFMRDGKIRYHDGVFHDVMTAESNRWYRMRVDFVCKEGSVPVYEYDIYVDGVLKISGASFYSGQNSLNNLRIFTTAVPFKGYFDAFGFSWDSNYDYGDNNQTYSVEGTPFEHGMNVIVVPTELFTHTLLNGYLENDNLDQTPLYHPDKNIFEFSAIERDGQPNQANADADLMFYRRSISPSDAMEVLELVLKGLLNETWEEENATYINSYICTKLNGTKATQMNLPYSVLGYIPWFNPYSNSKMGDEPIPSGGFDLFLWLLCLFNPILAESLHSQMAMSGGEYYKYLKGFTESILMSIMTFLGDLLWLIARAVLIVLAYIALAIELIVSVAIFAVLGASLYATSLLLENLSCEWGVNCIVPYGTDTKVGYLDLTLNDHDIVVEAYIVWEYFEFFDMYFPLPNIDVNSSIVEEFTNLVDDSEIDDAPPNLHCGFIETGDYLYQFSTIFSDVNNEAPNLVKLYLISPSGDSYNFDMEITDDYYKSINWWESEKIEDWYTNGEFENGYFDFDEQTDEFDPPAWKFGVNYTIDIDFSDSQTFNQSDIEGQWFYYFKTQDITTDEVRIWPLDYYGTHMQPGPRLDQDIVSFLAHSYVNTTRVWESKDIEFGVTGYRDSSSSSPSSVKLMIISPDLSIDSFSMTLDSTYTYQNQVVDSFFYNKVQEEYIVTVDIDQTFIFQDDTDLCYYFEAEYSNGDRSALWWSSADEDGVCYNSLFDPVEVLILTENGNTEIKDYYLESDGNYVSLKGANLATVTSETVVRFWVGIASDSSHSEIFDSTDEHVTPILMLSDNPLNPEDIREIDLDMVLDPNRNEEGLEWYYVDILYDMYSYIWEGDIGQDGDNSVDVWKIDFGPGLWDIEFEVTDPRTSNVHSLTVERQVWHSGSVQSFFSAMWSGPAIASATSSNPVISEAGIYIKLGISIGYGVAAILAQFATTQVAARALTLSLIAVDVVMQFIGVATFIANGDAGALLGSAVNGFFSIIGFLGSIALSRLGNSITSLFNGKFQTVVKFIGKSVIVLQLFSMLLSTLCNPLLLLSLIPMLISTVMYISSNKYSKLFGGLAVVISVMTGIISMFNIPDPDFGEAELWFKAPLPVVGFLISTLSLGAILGIIGATSSSNFVSNWLKVYIGITIASTFLYLTAYIVQTQLLSVMGGLIPYILGGNTYE